MFKFSKFGFLRDYIQFKSYLPQFFLNPFEKIKTPPSISWQGSIAAVMVINLFYGSVRSLVHFDILQFIVSVLVAPIMAAAVLGLISLFLYYFLQYMFDDTHPLQDIMIVVLLAYLPGSLFFFGSVFYAPLYLLGLLIMSVIAVRGLVENFKIPKNTVVSLVTICFLLAIVFWVFNEFYGFHAPVKPKSMDQLEYEIDDIE